MMVLCRLSGVSALGGGSSIYCDTLSVSQYDSKVRSGLPCIQGVRPYGAHTLGLAVGESLNNLFELRQLDHVKNAL